jgi:hypothetical protein
MSHFFPKTPIGRCLAGALARTCPSRIRNQAAIGSWTKSRHWDKPSEVADPRVFDTLADGDAAWSLAV